MNTNIQQNANIASRANITNIADVDNQIIIRADGIRRIVII
jgi:hypothetical protein